MTDDRSTTDGAADAGATEPKAPRTRHRAASRPAGPPTDAAEATAATGAAGAADAVSPTAPLEPGEPTTTDTAAPAKRARAARTTKTAKTAKTAKAASTANGAAGEGSAAPDQAPAESASAESAPAESAPAESAPTETAPTQTAGEAAPVKRATRKRAAKKTAPAAAAPTTSEPAPAPDTAPATGPDTSDTPDTALAPTKATRKRASRARTSAEPTAPVEEPQQAEEAEEPQQASPVARATAAVLFQAPDPAAAPPRRRRRAVAPAGPAHVEEPEAEIGEQPAAVSEDLATEPEQAADAGEQAERHEGEHDEEQGGRKRRRRGGRGRRRRSEGDAHEGGQHGDEAGEAAGEHDDVHAGQGDDDHEHGEDDGDHDEEGSSSSRRRRRRRRRAGSNGNGEGAGSDDPPGTVTKVRQGRKHDDEVASVKGSTRLEAKKQRRRDGREAGRRKQIITESEFLARRESVERTMIVRERSGRTQIAVLEDDVLVEHYVANETNTSMIGNVYLGRVQNVLPSMEAAFVDIGKGRNAVLYAGEVNWDAAGLEGQPRRIEQALKSGDTVLVQVTKDPLGHKGARLTSQISLPGRYLVYVPNSSMTGISRKLPDTERSRLKKILKAVVPEHAGVIVRTAAEGASEEELARDVTRLTAQWEEIQRASGSSAGGSAPKLLHGEPDLTIRVVRDVFNEDFSKLVVSGDGAWEVVQPYLTQVAPDLAERASRWTAEQDVFAAHRVDEQLAKAMDRKVYLPSGGSLVIDRTEAMTVVDVNTGKFTGAGGNLEETVTRNNLEAAEEIVRQLRLRDIGGIIVVDFIDMVLESNRDLVLRRLVECLGRDRTKHQVAEVTSLGLVQMTRKRVGQGLVEVFSEPCEHCNGRGIIIHSEPVSKNGNGAASGSTGSSGSGGGTGSGSGRSRRGKGGSGTSGTPAAAAPAVAQVPRGPIPAGLVASLTRHHDDDEHAEHHDEQLGPHEVSPPSGEGAVAELSASTSDDAGQPTASPESPAEPVAEPPAEPPAVASKPRRRRRAASAPAGPPVRHDGHDGAGTAESHPDASVTS